MVFKQIISLLLLTCFALSSSGQISYGGIPASFSNLKKTALVVPIVELEPVDNNQLLKAELADPENLKSFYFAKDFDVDISPNTSGLWERSTDFKIWRVGIRSSGAFSLNLIFDQMIIPKGALLFIYSKGKEKVLGAFTSDNEQASGFFSTFPISGDEIVVEYNEPLDTDYPGQIHISTVNHDYKNLFGTRPLGESGLCNMDVYCANASDYSVEKQSVVDMIVSGRELCTGTLVNNSKQDKTPYLLTAAHCIENASDAQKTIFCFNYESPTCGNGASSLNGFAEQTLSGSTLKARSDSLDFALVELSTPPPAKFRPYLAGWNKSATIPTSTFAFHHPKGDVKKLCKDNDAPKIGNYSSEFVRNSFWIIGKWEIGTTEAGSSGGGLFNQNRQVVGTLTGGTATCSDPTNDLFSMLNKQWDYYKTSDKQLKAWLDPNSSGVSELLGLNPFDSSNLCDLFTNAELGEKFVLERSTNQSNGYKTGHNNLKISSYAERFGKTDKTVLSSVSIGVAKITSSVMNTNSKIALKVYDEDGLSGLPGQELVSMDLPFSVLSEKKMNYIALENPLVLLNRFFIGYQINYSNPKDTFAVYHTPDRLKLSKNQAFAKSGTSWKPFYWVPALGTSCSLLINANGCQNTLAVIDNPTVDETSKFQVLYPQTGITNYFLLHNKGNEEYAVITLYDILGRKLFVEERMLSTVPRPISTGNYHSGIYFLTVETATARQVIKVKVIKPN
jgi:hypothetical protein